MRITIDVDESTGQASVSGPSQTVAAAGQGGGFDGGAAFVANGLGVMEMSSSSAGSSAQNGGSAPNLERANISASARRPDLTDRDGGKAPNQ